MEENITSCQNQIQLKERNKNIIITKGHWHSSSTKFVCKYVCMDAI